jgi:hypothetical protein
MIRSLRIFPFLIRLKAEWSLSPPAAAFSFHPDIWMSSSSSFSLQGRRRNSCPAVGLTAQHSSCPAAGRTIPTRYPIFLFQISLVWVPVVLVSRFLTSSDPVLCYYCGIPYRTGTGYLMNKKREEFFEKKGNRCRSCTKCKHRCARREICFHRDFSKVSVPVSTVSTSTG